MGIRDSIRIVNEHKAVLLANQDSYSEEYLQLKLAQYDDFLEQKTVELKAQKKRQKLFSQGSIVFILLAVISLGLYFGPAMTGYLTFENVTGGDNISNLTISAALVNETVISDFSNISSFNNETYPDVRDLSEGDNISNLTVSAAPADESVISPSLNLTNYTDVENVTEGSASVGNVSGVDISNLTISAAPDDETVISDFSNISSLENETYPDVKDNATGGENVSNLTISAAPANESVTPGISFNYTDVENVSGGVDVSNLTISAAPVNETVIPDFSNLTNVSVAELNLPPNGSVPAQVLEPNMAIGLNLKEYFTDPEDDNLSYSVDEHEHLDVYVKKHVLHIASRNETGHFQILVFVSDGYNLIASIINVSVEVYDDVLAEEALLVERLAANVTLVKVLDTYDVNISKMGNEIRFTGLDDLTLIEKVEILELETLELEGKVFDFGTEVVVVNNLSVTATVSLEKTGPVNAIVKCVDDACTEFVVTDIPFEDNGTHITFDVEGFSGYGGAYITIINVQSYPTVGGNWTVRFNTTGAANLTIGASNGTTYGTGLPDDLEWLQVKCGETVLASGSGPMEYQFNGTHVSVLDWNCSDVGYHTVKVHTPGVHDQEFVFGEQTGFAHNIAGPCNSFPGQNKTITSHINCSSSNMTLNSLVIESGGFLNLSGISLTVNNFTVQSGGRFTIEDSKTTMWVNGNWTISGFVNITNTTVRMNGTVDGEVGINVTSTGWLIVNDSSNITNGDTADAEFFFIVNSGSNFSMEDSYLSEAGWTDSLGKRGLEINISNISIKNNVFSNNYHSLSFYSGDNFIFNNTFIDEFRGIYLDSSDNNSIYLNTFNSTTYAVSAWTCSYNNISSNSFIDNSIAIEGWQVNLTLFTNSTITSSMAWYLGSSSNNTFTDLTIHQGGPMFYAGSNGNEINNVRFYNISGSGLNIQSSHENLVINSSFKNMTTGIGIQDGNNNTITQCNITNSSVGIYFEDNGVGNNPETNLIYNNFFNNSLNIQIEEDTYTVPNYLNTTQQTATNIMGGNYIGGNYWTNSTGNGYSDTCTDSVAPIGICDDYYNLSNGTSTAIDWLPLSAGYTGSCDHFCYNCSNCTDEIASASAGEIVCLADNISNYDGTCVDFNGSDEIIFDCQNNNIDGNFNNDGSGIEIAIDSDNNTIRNCNVTEFAINYNLDRSTGILVANSTSHSAYRYHLYVNAVTDDECNHQVINLTDGGYNVSYYNQSVNLSDTRFAQLLLCNADNSNISNVTSYSPSVRGGAPVIYRTEDSVFNDLTSIDNFNGIGLYYGNNNTFENLNISLSTSIAFLMSNSDDNIVRDSTITSLYRGIRVTHCEDNIFSNVSVTSTDYGFSAYALSFNNTLANSTIEGCTNAVQISVFSTQIPMNNTFYNNIMNCTNAYLSESNNATNYFNISITQATNIMGGSWIGGNYWTDPDGNFSDTCTDLVAPFGVCDVSYSLDDNNTDFLALSTGAVNNNTCSPTPGNDLVVSSTLTCQNTNITVDELMVEATGFLNLTNITLIAGKTTVAGAFRIIDSPGTVWQNGNLTISGSYNLTNTTLRMNGTTDGQIGINVTSTGWLIVNDSSNITNGDTAAAHYFFLVNSGSNFSMEDSYLSEAGWNNSVNCRGLEIDTTVDSFYGNTLTKSYSGAVFYSDNNTIEDNIFDQNDIGLYMYYTSENSIVDNITGTNSIYYGIYLRGTNNTLKNSIFEDNSEFGVFLRADNSTVVNVTLMNNTNEGLHIYGSSYNAVNNITVSGSGSGIVFRDGNDNVITNSTIFNNSIGVEYENITETLYNNSVFNNIFNNTKNILVEDGIGYENYLNTSQISATNIMGGNYIGGNYWTNSTGNGYSDTCTDLIEPWGICDDYYNLSNGTSIAIDWLPLSAGFTGSAPVITLNDPPNASSTTENYVVLNATVTDVDNDTMDANLYAYYADELDSSETGLWEGLVALWHFNNDSSVGENDSLVYDWSGNGHSANCTSCPTYEAGKYYGAYDFGNNGFFLVGNDSKLSPENYTITAWIKPADLLGYDFIVEKGEFDDDDYGFALSGDELIMEYIGDTYHVYSTNNANLEVDEWYFVTLTFDSEISFYKNGKLLSSVATPEPKNITTSDLKIGAQKRAAYEYIFDGSIDEVAIWNRSLSDNEIFRLYDKGRYKLIQSNTSVSNGSLIQHNLTSMPLSVQEDMVLLMHFDNDSGYGENDTLVYDWTGMGNNGTAHVNNSDGTARGANATGRFGWAYEFDGVDDYISIENSPEINLENNITVSAWFNMKSWKESNILEKGGSSGYILWTAPSRANSIVWGRQANTWSQLNSITKFNTALNQWIHIVGTYDGTYLKLYVNGVIDNQIERSFTFNNNGPLTIGDGIDSVFDGTIDEVAIWNRSLSATEIWQIYSMQAGRYYWQGNVTDGTDAGESDIWFFELNNSIPTVESVAITPASPTTNDDLVCTINITDFDNDTLTVNVTWYINGAESVTNNSISYNQGTTLLQYLPSNYTSANDVIICSVIANDSYSNTGWVNASSTIGNAAPSISLLSPPNASSTTENFVLLNATVTDPDNDTMDANLYAYKSLEIDTSTYEDSELADGLVLLMHLNNDSNVGENDTHVYDWSGVGNNGTVFDANLTESGKFRSAFEFDGNGDNIQIPLTSSLNTTTGSSWTLAAWIKPVITSNTQYIVNNERDSSAPRGGMILLNWDDNFYMYVYNSSGDPSWSFWSGAVTGVWYHLVGVYNSTHTILYVDGIQRDSDVAVQLSYTDQEWRIGNDAEFNIHHFNGTIDEVAIWNRSLSANEIFQLYDKGRYKLIQSNTSVSNNSLIQHNLTSMPLSVQEDMVLLMHFDNDSSMGENDTLVYDWTGHCYDNETEILTDQGWKHFRDLKDEKVATLNNVTYDLEWQTPMEKQVFDYDKDMYRIVLEEGSDLLVSEKHKVFAGSPSISRVMMLKSKEDNNSFINSELQNKTLHDMHSIFSCEIMPKGFVMCGIDDDLSHLLPYSPADNRTFLTGLGDALFAGWDNVHCVDHLSLLKNSSTDLYLNDFSFLADLSFFTNSSLSGSSSTGCQSTSSQNIQSSSVISPVSLYLSNISRFIISSLETSDQFIQENFSSSEYDESSNEKVMLTIYSTPLFSSSLNFFSLASFFNAPSFATSDQFMSGRCSSLFLSSFGIDTVNLFMTNTSGCVDTRRCVQSYKSFENLTQVATDDFTLVDVTLVYEQIKSGKSVYFLNSDNEPIKIESISREPYEGKIYDVDVENDIVLVRRHNGTALWSGNSNNGTVYVNNSDGTARGANATGRFGWAYEFDGDDYINHSTITFSSTDSWTAAHWVNWKGLKTTPENVFYMGTPGSFNSLLLRHSNDNRFSMRNSVANYLDFSAGSSEPYYQNGWFHLTWIANGSSLSLFIDGNFLETVQGITSMSFSSIGKGFSTNDYDLNGTIDEVAIWNRSLSATEIWEMYSLSAGRYYWKGNVTDGTDSSESDVWWFELNNSIPVVESVVISPTSPTTTDDLICNINITDADGDNLTVNVTWYLNSAENITNTSIAYQEGTALLQTFPSNYTSSGDTVICSVIANDTYSNSGWLNSSSVSIGNTAPSISLLSPPNASTTTENTVLLNASITDADNDTMDANLYGYYADEIDSTETGLWNGLVALWHFNNDSSVGENDTLVYDWSGNGNNGTVTSASWQDSGKFKGGFVLDGVDDYVLLPNETRPTGEFTISLWFRTMQEPEDYTVQHPTLIGGHGIGLSDNRAGVSLTFSSFNQVLYLDIYNTTSDSTSEYYLSAWGNDWYHVLATRNTTNQALWINGIKVDSDSTVAGEINWSGYPLFRIGYGYRGYLNGSVDELGIWNRTLSAHEIMQLYDKGREKLLYAGTNLSNGTEINYNLTSMPLSVQEDMVLLMHFDNDSSMGENDTHVYDWTGLGSNGTCTGASCPAWNESGRFGGAYDFDGNDHIDLTGDEAVFDVTENYTISLWFNMEAYNNNFDGIISKNLLSNNGWALYFISSTTDQLTYLTGPNPGDYFSFGPTGPDYVGNWTLVTISANSSHASAYLNGVYKGSGALNKTENNVNVTIGRLRQGGSSYYFTGKIDDVAIWNRTLDATEIQEIYELQAGRYYWYGNATDSSSSDETDVWWFEKNATVSSTDSNTCTPTTGNDLEITSTVSCENQNITVDFLNITGYFNLTNVTLVAGDVVVNSGASFRIHDSPSTMWLNGNWTISGFVNITNTTVRMNGTSDGQVGINVTSTGWLIVNDSSNITNGDTAAAEFFFVVNSGSNFSMEDSYLSECGWADTVNQRGLEIDTTMDIFRGNTLINNFNGLTLYSDNNIIEDIVANSNTLGMYWYYAHNNNMTNVTANSNTVGIHIDYSDNNQIRNITTSSNTDDGFYLDSGSEYNNISDIAAIGNTDVGVYVSGGASNFTNINTQNNDEGMYMNAGSWTLYYNNIYSANNTYGVAIYYSNNHKITNLSAIENDYGVWIRSNSDYNIVDDSTISKSNIAGIWFESTSSDPDNNTIYNCIINNSVNFHIDQDEPIENYLNTSQTTATNIMGGNYIGGNYWTNSTGNGYSDTCADVVSPFGICDDYYNLSNGTSVAIDYLPLSSFDTHNTSLAVSNSTDSPTAGTEFSIFANFTADDINVSGVGLNRNEIGTVIWNTTDLDDDVDSVKFFDCNKDRMNNCLALATDDYGAMAFYPNGTSMNWGLSGVVRSVQAFDYYNDSYFSDIVSTRGTGGIRWYNESGDLIDVYDPGSNSFLYVELCDVNNDSVDDFIAATQSREVFAVAQNGSQIWNTTFPGGTNILELECADVNEDGVNDVVSVVGRDNVTVLYGQNGSIMWDSGDIYAFGIAVIDLDCDGEKDEVLGSDNTGTEYIIAYNSSENGEVLWQIEMSGTGSGNDFAVFDWDGDGCENEFVVSYDETFLYSANMTTYTHIWNVTHLDNVEFVHVKDINNDGYTDVISTDLTRIYFLNHSGRTLGGYNVTGPIGSYWSFGNGKMIDTSDVNLDGINDIAIASWDNHAYVIQEVSCVASFNDSTYYNMTWNQTDFRWEINKTFTTGGTYEYNVTCSKGGYETAFASSSITVDPAPIVQEVNITPYDGSAYTNSTLRCYANITSTTSATFNADFQWYQPNGSLWDSETVLVSNNSINYSTINITWNNTHHDDSWLCRVRGLTGNWSNVTRVIGNYSTSLAVDNETDSPVSGQVVRFYANYTSDDFNMSGIGFTRNEIGLYLLNNTYQYTPNSVEIVDLDRDHIINDFIVTTEDGIYAMYANGTEVWTRGFGWSFLARAAAVSDFDNNSYYDDIAYLRYDRLEVLNHTGGVVFTGNDIAISLGSIVVEDFDGDGLKNDIAVGRDLGGTTRAVSVYNSSNGSTWTNIWNFSFTSGGYIYEMSSADVDDNGDMDLVVDSFEGIYTFTGKNGSEIFKSLGKTTSRTIAIADIAHDGTENDIIMGEYNDVYGYRFNGTYNASIPTGEYIFYNSNVLKYIREVHALDLDRDGFRDDIILGDSGLATDEYGYLRAYDNDSNSVWNVQLVRDSNGIIHTYSLTSEDLNDDGVEDILGSSDQQFYVLNLSGNFIHHTYASTRGNMYGKSPGAVVADFNQDGINDFLLTMNINSTYIAQVVGCTASFNDSTSYNMTWNNTDHRWEVSKSFGSGGTYSYNVTCQKGGYATAFASSEINVSGNSAPKIDTINITPTTAYYNSTFNCSVLPIDNQSINVNVSFTWYVNGALNSSWDTSIGCTNNSWCYTYDYPSGFSKHDNITCSARAFDGSLYSYWKNSSEVEIQNSLPSNVTLILPTDGQILLNRTPEFNWTNATDTDNDPFTYQIQILREDCGWPLGCSVDNVTENVTDLNFTPSTELDLDSWYNWSVRVWDGEAWGIWSETWNFTVLSTSMLMLNATVNFSSMVLNEADNTTDDNPIPFLLENNGNVKLNVSIYAQDPLWTSVELNTSYFQYKIDNKTTQSFDSMSKTSWTVMRDTSETAIYYFNYTGSDQCEIDILVQVPGGEPEGIKNSTIIVEGVYAK